MSRVGARVRWVLLFARRTLDIRLGEPRFSGAGRSVMGSPPVNELSERAREIFRRVVEGYLDTGHPVGSKTLAGEGALNLSPASIRSVLAELETLGLLAAPHT